MENTVVSPLNRITLTQFIDGLLICTLAIFVGYTIWFQYAVNVIGSFMTIIGLIMLVLVIIRLLLKFEISYFSKTIMIISFIFIFGSIGILFAKHPHTFNTLFSKMVLYLIPMYAIIVYVRHDKYRLDKILKIFAIATLAISISIFTKGSLTATNALTVGAYNTNALSNYLIIGSFCLLFLTLDAKNSYLKILIWFAVGLEFATQIVVASRRGTLVHISLIILFILSSRKTRIEINRIWKWIIVLIVFAVILYTIYNHFGDQIESLIIIKRFFGDASTERGDFLRRSYQATALRLFIESPFVGVGLGGVNGEIGVYSHSLYYELLACTGLLGFILMVGQFLYYLYIFRLKSKRNSGVEESIIKKNRFAMWFCCSVLISGFAVTYIYDISFFYIIAIIVSLINVNCIKRFT